MSRILKELTKTGYEPKDDTKWLVSIILKELAKNGYKPKE